MARILQHLTILYSSSMRAIMRGLILFSVIVIWLIESDIVFCVNNEVTGINVIALDNHIEYFWVMNSTLFHEVNNLILDNNGVVNIVIELNLDLVLKLTLLC